MAFAPDATADPAQALRTAVAGTQAVFDGVGAARLSCPILVSGSSEVYGDPRPGELPIPEEAPLRASRPYGLVKLAQEAVALEAARRREVPVVVTRSFNHIGPGQRPVFAVPAFARRIVAFRDGLAEDVPAGNLDVRRDFTDVRDVVRAYRLLLEGLAGGVLAAPLVVNVASGQSVAIREIVERLGEAAGVVPRVRVDPALVRAGEPADMVGARRSWSGSRAGGRRFRSPNPLPT